MLLPCPCPSQALRNVQENGVASVGEYKPSDPEILDLLSRDPSKDVSVEPFVQAMYDALLITIKGVAAGMQNTG